MIDVLAIDFDLEQMSARAETRGHFWIDFVGTTRTETMLEIGVWKGEFAAKMLGGCETLRRYYMIDPWAQLPDWDKPFNVEQQEFDDIFAEAMQNTAFAEEKRVVLRGRTKEVIDEIPDESLDLAYIDGDHTLRGITIDLIKLYPKVKPGGFICGDDFGSDPWQHASSFEPTLVFPFAIYFAEAMNHPLVALPRQQFVMQKTKDRGFAFVDTVGKYANLSLSLTPSTQVAAWAKRTARSVIDKIR